MCFLRPSCVVFLCIIALFFMICGCGPGKRPPVTADNALDYVSGRGLPSFKDDMPYSSLKKAVESAGNYLKGLDPDKMLVFGPDKYPASRLLKTIDALEQILDTKPTPYELAQAIKERFIIYQSVGTDGKGTMLFTGYYEPLLVGSPDYNSIYPHPIYGKPDDLVCVNLGDFKAKYAGEHICGRFTGDAIIPYYTREEIEKYGGLEGEGYEIAWVKDPVDLFFLHIQGSGRIIDENGKSFHIHYAGKNGRAYSSIGKLLIDDGKISREEMSMQKLRSYIKENPDESERILNHNQSYVFFSIANQPAIGYAQQPLIAGRCVAVDYRIFPMGALGYIQSQKPVVYGDRISHWVDMGRFVLSMDTGGAIRGPGRMDLFCGNGSYAELFAGHMKHDGVLYFLIVKDEFLD